MRWKDGTLSATVSACSLLRRWSRDAMSSRNQAEQCAVYELPRSLSVYASCTFCNSCHMQCAGPVEGGSEAILRATERVRQAALPVYSNLFTPISNQPQGGLRAGCQCARYVVVAVMQAVAGLARGRAQVPGGPAGRPARLHPRGALGRCVAEGPGEGAAVRRSPAEPCSAAAAAGNRSTQKAGGCAHARLHEHHAHSLSSRRRWLCPHVRLLWRRRNLAEWFSVGLLHLEQITWSTSSGALLEKVK